MHAQLLELSGYLKTLGSLLDHQQVVAFVPALPARLGDDQGPVTPGTVGDEDFAAVDDELVSVALRHRRDARHVAACVRLGDRDRGDLFAADGGGQPAAFLVVSPELEDGRRRHLGLDRNRHAQTARPSPAQLFRKHDRREIVATLPAVLGWVLQAEEAKLPKTPENLVRECLLLPLLEVRLHLAFKY